MPRILMIEDDADFAEIIIECLLEQPGFFVHEVILNQEDARTKFQSGILHNMDAVLVDLQIARSRSNRSINGNAGLELIEEMRSTHAYRGKIIVLTNSNALSDGHRAWTNGCDGYLCKHLRSQELPDMISRLALALRGETVLVPKEMRHIFWLSNAGRCDVQTIASLLE